MKKTLILSGMGLNCERETRYSCEKSGATKIDIVNTLDFLKNTTTLKDYNFIIFIGGFLDGDYLGSARVGANRFKYINSKFKDDLLNFIVGKQNLVLGICNGFQLLVKLGILPETTFKQTISLTTNEKGIFEDRWSHLKVNSFSNCIFTKGIKKMYLPIRHGEGRLISSSDPIKDTIFKQNQIVLQYTDPQGEVTSEYPHNPNGSWQNVAALCNEKGNVLGMMPHPEAFNHYTNHPHWTSKKVTTEDGEGLQIFKNAYNYLNNV